MNHTYIKGVEIKQQVLNKLNTGFQDRLGTFAIITIEKHSPNQEYVNRRSVDTINHILDLMFGAEMGRIDSKKDFQEVADSFIVIEGNILTIKHKYWSLKYVQFFTNIIERLGQYKGFVVKFR